MEHNSKHEPANKTLVHRYLNWDLVSERLSRYKHIGAVFDINEMKKCQEKIPYFCHYLAWRLGTWQNEQLFGFFDQLLARGMEIRGWSNDRIYKDCEFGNFWSFLWELQVCAFFVDLVGATYVRWGNQEGPDLAIIIEGNELFIECTVPRKSFGLEEYINELLQQIDTRINAKHRPFTAFSLQKKDKVQLSRVFDELFETFLDNAYLEEVFRKTKINSPELFSSPSETKNFFIYTEDVDTIDTNPEQPWNEAGDPVAYQLDAIEKIQRSKENQNNLPSLHPNLLAVNFLLGVDFQLAEDLREIPIFTLSDTLDGIFITSCGINEIPTISNSCFRLRESHPLEHLIRKRNIVT